MATKTKMAKAKASQKKAKAKASQKKAKRSRKLHTITVVSASDRNEARRILASELKGMTPQDRNEARRGMARIFKAAAQGQE